MPHPTTRPDKNTTQEQCVSTKPRLTNEEPVFTRTYYGYQLQMVNHPGTAADQVVYTAGSAATISDVIDDLQRLQRSAPYPFVLSRLYKFEPPQECAASYRLADGIYNVALRLSNDYKGHMFRLNPDKERDPQDMDARYLADQWVRAMGDLQCVTTYPWRQGSVIGMRRWGFMNRILEDLTIGAAHRQRIVDTSHIVGSWVCTPPFYHTSIAGNIVNDHVVTEGTTRWREHYYKVIGIDRDSVEAPWGRLRLAVTDKQDTVQVPIRFCTRLTMNLGLRYCKYSHDLTPLWT